MQFCIFAITEIPNALVGGPGQEMICKGQKGPSFSHCVNYMYALSARGLQVPRPHGSTEYNRGGIEIFFFKKNSLLHIHKSSEVGLCGVAHNEWIYGKCGMHYVVVDGHIKEARSSAEREQTRPRVVLGSNLSYCHSGNWADQDPRSNHHRQDQASTKRDVFSSSREWQRACSDDGKREG